MEKGAAEDEEVELLGEAEEVEMSQGEAREVREEVASEKEAGSGIIESIHLINFMSHANLKLELGPQQNFITGPNGAGKSAILVALLTALGAKTGFTGRGARLGDMVRNSPEATSAVITVRLRNRAPEGYRPEVYGESIVVVKTISKEGPSSLKIRTAAGQDTEEMTTDKLGEILDHLNIQVDNPCAVLLQETSKNFLSQSTPKQKYSFFLQATQLAPIRNNYQAIEKNLATLEELLGRKKKQLPGLRQYVERCREAYESLNRVNQLEEQRRDLRVQAAWSAYAEKLRKLAALRDKKEKLDEGMGRKEREMEGFRASKDGAQQQLLTLEAQLAAIVADLESHERTRRAFETRIRELTNQTRAAQGKTTALQEKKKTLHVRAERIRTAIAKEQQDQSQQYLQQIAAIKEQIEQEQGRRGDLLRQLQPKQEQIRAHRADMDAVEQERRALQSQINTAQRQHTDAQRNLEALQHETENRVSAFGGPHLPEFLQLIHSNASRFQRMPVGPIGSHITIRDGFEKWSAALELVLGQTAQSFIAFSFEDEKLLRSLYEGLRRRTSSRMPALSTFTSRYRATPYSIPPSKLPKEHLLTVAKAVSIDHPNVFNILVDDLGIERTCLTETYEETKRQLFGRDSDRANIKEVLNPDTSRFSYRSGSQNIVPPRPPDRTTLSSNPASRLAYARSRKEEAEQLVRSLRESLGGVENRLQQLDAAGKGLSRAAQQEESALRRVDATIGRLEDDRRHQEAQLAKSSSRVDEKTQQQEQLEQLVQQQEGLDGEILRAQQHTEAVEGQIEQVRVEMNYSKQDSALVDRSHALKNEIALAEATVAQEEQMLNRAQLFVAKLKDHLAKVIAPSLSQAEGVLAEFFEAAQREDAEAPEDLDALRPFQELQDQIELITHQITEELQDTRSPTDITYEFRLAEKKYRTASSRIGSIEQFIREAVPSLKHRVKIWENLRRSITGRVSGMFYSYLDTRNHGGTIKFDHEAEELDVHIVINRGGLGIEEARKSGKALHAQTTKTLSGGERSFSTVALLMALWSEMTVPFRAMDEFDVFMDGANRKIAIALLQELAQATPHKQYIFITPHDTSQIDQNGSNVKIHCLNAPRDTSQIVLGFASRQQRS